MFNKLFVILAIALVGCSAFEITTKPALVPVAQPQDGPASCDVCNQVMDQGLNILLNYLLNGGVVGGCAELCGLIPEKYAAYGCDLLCDFVGMLFVGFLVVVVTVLLVVVWFIVVNTNLVDFSQKRYHDPTATLRPQHCTTTTTTASVLIVCCCCGVGR